MATVVWQGFRLELPSRWDAIKLEGDAQKGYAAFADLMRERMGLRWQGLSGRRFDPLAWAHKTMRAEVGLLAAEEAKPVEMTGGDWEVSLLYTEPQPPGRDIWVGYSQVSRRGVVISYPTRRRDRMLADILLPNLVDLPPDEPMPWSVFELSCRVPAGMPLERQLLNAGDLSLTFTQKQRSITVRQVAVAQLALKRMGIERWLAQQQRFLHKHYRPGGQITPLSVKGHDGRPLVGVMRPLVRKKRFFFVRGLIRRYITYALHDEGRDRLILLQGSDDELTRQVLGTIGWAKWEKPVEATKSE